MLAETFMLGMISDPGNGVSGIFNTCSDGLREIFPVCYGHMLHPDGAALHYHYPRRRQSPLPDSMDDRGTYSNTFAELRRSSISLCLKTPVRALHEKQKRSRLVGWREAHLLRRSYRFDRMRRGLTMKR